MELAFVLPVFLLGTVTLICFMDVMRLQTEKISQLCEEAMETGMYVYTAEEKTPVVEIRDVYTYRLPISIVPLPAIVITNRGRVHSWIGMDESTAADTWEEMVYMAASGSVYHTNPRCSYLDLSVSQADGMEVGGMRNRYGSRYAPCASCCEGTEPADVVYITGQGTRYHNQITCSRLKRTVRLVPISEAKGRALCFRCQKSQ